MCAQLVASCAQAVVSYVYMQMRLLVVLTTSRKISPDCSAIIQNNINTDCAHMLPVGLFNVC